MTGTSAVGSNIYFFQQGNTQKLSSTNDQTASFSKTMDQTTGKSETIKQKTEDHTEQIKPKDRKALKVEDKLKTKIEDKSEENGQDKMDEMTCAVEKATDEIKNAIMKKLGLTEEEFETALQAMGFTMSDLLDTGKVMDLMVELTGSGDALTLLTSEELYSDVKDIMQFVENVKTDIKNEFDLDNEQLQELISGIKKDEQEIPVEKQETMQSEKPIVVELKHDDDQTKTQVKEPQGVQTESTFNSVKEIKQDNPQNQPDMKNQEKNDQPQQNQIPQTTQQTTTNSVGDIIETIRTYTSVDGKDILNQVTDFVKFNVSADTNSVEMQLHPASLGTVNIHITSQNGLITAQLIVQNEAVKAAMETQMIQLKDTFQEQGMKVEAVSVEIAQYDMDKDLSDNSQNGETKKDSAKQIRRKINLADLDSLSSEELSEEEQLNVEMMRDNGNSVDFSA